MSITKNVDRQDVLFAFVDISVSDAVAGAVEAAIELPVNASVLYGQAVTKEAWNSTTSDTLDVGDGVDDDRYLGAGNIRALAARVPLVPTGFVTTEATKTINVIWNSGGGTPTTGLTRLEVAYYIEGRANASYGK